MKEKFRRANKRSMSSIFSIRDYYFCECVVESDIIAEVLVKFYNVVIRRNHYLRRCLKVADAMLEKVKVLHFKELKILEMIEVDLKLVIKNG